MPEQGSIQQLLLKATAFYHSGDYQQAIQAWQEILSADPKNQRAKEGIRMASLLLEEAQVTADAAASASDTGPPGLDSAETIGKVREGIEQVRSFLASSRHLEAIEVCRSLLLLSPRSAAVHEILEEAREAYEAQPFINEHLEIARQLFIQERLDEAAAECQKILFLNPSHAEARKLNAKVQALKEKQSPAAVLPSPALESAEPARLVPSPLDAADPSETLPGVRLADLGGLLDPLQRASERGAQVKAEPAGGDSAATPSKSEGPAINEDWEQELAHLNLGPSTVQAQHERSSVPETADEAMPLSDLSGAPERPGRASAGRQPMLEAGPEPEAVLEPLHEDLLQANRREAGEALDVPLGETVVKPAQKRPVPPRPDQRSARSPLRVVLPLLGLILLGSGGAYWLLFLHGSSPGAGGGNRTSPPPVSRTPINPAAAGADQGGGRTNLGLSSTGSRGGNAAVTGAIGPSDGDAAIPGDTPVSSEPNSALPPEQQRREISRHMVVGRGLMAATDYKGAAEEFSKILEIDPANLEAKEQLDQAASRVLEQRQLEQDLQTAKEFFVEKDYESALRKFYRLPRDGKLGSLDLFIRNAWYNWGIVSLKGGNCVDALQRLQEAVTVDPNDQEAFKQQEVAQHYKDRPKDRVFYAYVDRLTFRTLNQK